MGPDTTGLYYNHGRSAEKILIDSLTIKNTSLTANSSIFVCAGTYNTHNKIRFERVYLVSTYDNVNSIRCL